jgi:hypothetical protein
MHIEVQHFIANEPLVVSGEINKIRRANHYFVIQNVKQIVPDLIVLIA